MNHKEFRMTFCWKQKKNSEVELTRENIFKKSVIIPCVRVEAALKFD